MLEVVYIGNLNFVSNMKKSLSIKSLVSEIIMKEQMKDKYTPTVLVLSSMTSDSKGTISKLKKSCEKFGLPFYAIRSKSAFIDTTQNSKNSLKIENYNGEGDVLLINPRNTICFVRGSAIKTEVGSALIHIMENYLIVLFKNKKKKRIIKKFITLSRATKFFNQLIKKKHQCI